MSCLEKKHVSHQARMQHPSNLDSFMDETDREVMNLTARAFKSLCIGDEAIYNDSELLPSPVDYHRQLPKEIPKKSHENSALDFKKHKAYQPNRVYNIPRQTKDTSKVSSVLAAFAGKKNNDSRITNGDSWDKSALLSIQTELSEFSLDYQNRLMNKHSDQIKSHHKPSETRKNKSTKDICKSSGKSPKNQHGKSAKLRKLKSINFFLHSEFSPFQTWDDLNRFGLDNMEWFPSSSPAGFYDSPIYRKLNNSNSLYVSELNKRGKSQSTSPLEPPQHKSEPHLSQCTAHNLKTIPQIPENHSEINFLQLPDIQIETLQPQTLLTSFGSFTRCQSEGDICAPWRKSRNKSKGVVQPFICSPACERSNTEEQDSTQNKKQVNMVEEGTCLNLTPLSISQLITPVIPSRQETGTSEILQSVWSPTALDIPALHKAEIHPSLEFKREEYKSKASSLLFNLKDNRKRVKATYSPPRFKGLDVVEQAKLFPLIEQDVTQNVIEKLEIADSKNRLAVQKTSTHSVSPDTIDIKNVQVSGHSTLPDDFLGLSLLLAENKGSKKNPLPKATYPSLNMYPKTGSGELNTLTMSVEVPVFQPTVNKSSDQNMSKDHLPEKNSKDSQKKHNLIKPEINSADHEYTHQNHVGTTDRVPTEKTNVVGLKEKHPILKKHNAQQDAGSRNQDKLNTVGLFPREERPVNYSKCHRKETKPKHSFSAQQNNYIKNQRCVNVGNDNDDKCQYWQEDVISAEKDEPRKNELNVHVHKDHGKVQESMDYIVTNDAFTRRHYNHPLIKDLGTCAEQGVTKNDALSMKGNTSAKIALFTFKEMPSNLVSGSMNKNIVKDNYELATVALEKRTAEREQRKKRSDRQPGQDLSMKGEHSNQSMLTSGQKYTSENVTPDSQEQKAISDFTATSQKVQSMSYINTNHSDCHMNELKLDAPCKQEGTAKHSPSRPEKNRNDRHGQKGDKSKNKSLANVTKLKETMHMPKNICLGQESSEVQDYFDNKIISVSKYYSDESIQETTPPRKDRAYSLSEDRAMNERQRKEDVTGVERSVKHEIRKSNIPKDKGPVTGHVSSLMEKVNREQVEPSFMVQECLGQVDNLIVYYENDSFNEKSILSNNKGKDILTDQKERNADSEKDLQKEESNEQNEGNIENINKCVAINEDKKDVTRTKNKNASDVLRKIDNQTTFKCYGKKSKKYLTDNFEKSDEPSHDSKVSALNLLNPDNVPMSDILNQTEPSLLVGGKQLKQGNLPCKLSEDRSFSHKTDESPPLNIVEKRKCETLDTNLSYFDYNHESKLYNSDLAVHPPKEVEKGEWVQCLIESARNLSPACYSNVSSPTLGKPALFKVKDNTFRASPVTKTVRPILHKSVAGVTQPWSPRESLCGSETGEEEQNLFKDTFEIQSPTLRIIQSNQSSIQVVYPPSSQSITELGRKGLIDSFTVVDKEEWQVAKCSFLDGTASFDISAKGTVEKLAFNTVPPDSIHESKASSERSDSACSGIENQIQGKPPAVPLKTEKAMRCAMKLTTKRIHKAEAKSKSDRGRSSDKGSCQKRERRHHSSDKVLSDRSYQRKHSFDRGSNDTSLPNSHKSERHISHSSLISMDRDAQSSETEKRKEIQSPQKHQFDTQKINFDCERSGSTSKKSLPQKLYRRAHSLDRFSSGKYEHSIHSSKDPTSKTNTETLKMHTTAETAPSPQNRTEHTYGSSANNMVSQSFPMTQRKLLQDLDSGQYFVVDMPVQVKTKTFFDPETGSYVLLPIQSFEGSVQRAQSVEVVNAPPLMLYHGFVPVPVSSLP